MADEPAAMVTDASVRSLAAKLTGLYALLTAVEQTLLHNALRCSVAHDAAQSDTTGFAWSVSFNPFPYLDKIARDLSSGEEEPRPYARSGGRIGRTETSV